MIKRLITNGLVCMAVIALAVAFMQGITERDWMDMGFYLGLLCMGILFGLWQLILQKIEIKSYILEVTVNFAVTFMLALILGKIFGWYTDLSNIIYVCIEIFIVFVICYFLGLMNDRREIAKINSILKKKQ